MVDCESCESETLKSLENTSLKLRVRIIREINEVYKS